MDNTLDTFLVRLENKMICLAIVRNGYNNTHAARSLGMSRRTLLNKKNKQGIKTRGDIRRHAHDDLTNLESEIGNAITAANPASIGYRDLINEAEDLAEQVLQTNAYGAYTALAAGEHSGTAFASRMMAIKVLLGSDKFDRLVMRVGMKHRP